MAGGAELHYVPRRTERAMVAFPRAAELFVTLYSFDRAGPSLELVPLAARRALDRAGCKLPLAGWRGLPLILRRELVSLGGEAQVPVERVQQIVAGATPSGEPVAPLPELSAEAPSPEVVEVYRPHGRLSAAIWSQLTPLARYALAKVASTHDGERAEAAYKEIVGHSQVSTHLTARGEVQMVNVAEKPVTRRRAEAESRVEMSAAAFELLASNSAPKGDVLGTARLAGIMAAKKTSDLIPLCHPLALTHVAVELSLEPSQHLVHVRATVETQGKTGVEMEALVAASAAALTIYDMLKASDRAMSIGPTRLVHKSGGASGDYTNATPVRDP
jgi:molybdenum cofactor biosynthesis protein MoaC